ncbi:EamA/RhaT family transporter [Microvirga sp. KLBC 81]|uniref:DMT family transporter n=1 Tax=Microvirga sp. KLBC 81 TaxID=1862707 RepID=UPI000D513851|nr:DMT family transporter [Microvirga sp. KLBC 81]PVE20402.1 EamA/RhaT family transporter [Microvirga sp. KLBC 81]
MDQQISSLDARSDSLRGIAFAAAGYALLATQDAIVKWLVTSYTVPQILFIRSILIVVFVISYSWFRGEASILKSPNKLALITRAVFTLAAWLTFYTAARQLQLAEMTTIYFVAPVIVVILSLVILKEHVGASKWIAVIVGFGGVLIAMDPSSRVDLVPALLVLCAAFCWAMAAVLVRRISGKETSLNQMLSGSLVFMLACLLVLPSVWVTPNIADICLMAVLGGVGGLGQFMLYEGLRFAPASTVAPVEYSILVWAVLYGFLIWNEQPSAHVLLGASLIILSGIWLVRRRT